MQSSPLADTDLGRSIRYAMQLAGEPGKPISRFELARRTGIKRQQVGEYVNGKVVPGYKNLSLIALALGQPMAFFLNRHDEDPEW
jgi:transcriptional regulator with XRE-family HTH domain